MGVAFTGFTQLCCLGDGGVWARRVLAGKAASGDGGWFDYSMGVVKSQREESGVPIQIELTLKVTFFVRSHYW